MTVGDLWSKYRSHLVLHGGRAQAAIEDKTLEDYGYWAAMVLEDWPAEHGREQKDGWAHTSLANVTRQSVADWVAELPARRGGPASASARRRVSAFFNRMMTFAASEGLVERNPLLDRAGKAIPMPRAEPTKTQVRLTMPQLARLAAASREHSLLRLFSGLTGLRWGEVSTLRRRHLDFGPQPTVFVERDIAKTDVERVVPIPALVATALMKAVKESQLEDLVFPSRQGRMLDEKNFRNRHYSPAGEAAGTAVAILAERLGVRPGRRRVEQDGQAVQVAVFTDGVLEAMHKWQEREGLERASVTTPELWRSLAVGNGDKALERLERVELGVGDVDFLRPTFHNLRHTAVSLAIQSGGNVMAVQRIAGHKSASVTLDVYADLFEDHLHDVAAQLDAALAQVPQAVSLL